MLSNPDLNFLWEECLYLLKEELTSVGFNTWIKDIKPVSIENNTLTLAVGNNIIKNMAEVRYRDLIKNTVGEIAGVYYDIEFILFEDVNPPEKREPQSSPYEKYTFDNFVVGNSNRFAQSASLAVAEAPAYAYNPLFLYGGVGLGKTHLMHAIGNYIKSQNPTARIEFLSAETFTNELINSIKDNKNQEFRDKYRNIDVLLVDDIQFIAGKTTTEEEFFHTFNALHEANKQIVLTSDRSPNEIKTLEERLRSRFGWGLMCKIESPDYEMRIAILRKKAQSKNVIISDDILEYIAENFSSNIRELEGVFNRVVAYRGLINKEITLEIAKDILEEYVESNEKKITPDSVIEACAKFYNVKKEDIYSNKKTKEIAFARQVAIYLIREVIDYSFPKIGAFLGKDHSTAIYAHKQVKKLMESDIGVKINIESLMNDIKNN